MWQRFITNYSATNPNLVDNESCHSCFKLLSQSSTPLLSPEIVPGRIGSNVAKRFKLSDSDLPGPPTVEANPVIMFTGFNPTALKKFKSV